MMFPNSLRPGTQPVVPPACARPATARAALAFALAWLAALIVGVPAARAHQPGTSSLVLAQADDGSLRGEVHVADVDLAAIDLMLEDRLLRAGGPGAGRTFDPARDGWRTLPWLRLAVDGQTLSPAIGGPERVETDGRVHTMIPFTAAASPDGELVVGYVDFFGFDPQHKVVTSLALPAGGEPRVGLLSLDEPSWTVRLGQPGALGQFITFTWEGVWHIWIGIDHILFLVALLLPSVLTHEDGRWKPAARFRTALINVLKIVTAFTVAHSVTLSLAALDIVRLPAKGVEVVIAVSVLLAALNNLRPVVLDRAWAVAFGFGLVHGFGFANVLADLQLPAGTLAVALVSFNVGVELGQLVIVGAFFPLAFLLRTQPLYLPVKLRLGSAVIALVSTAWIVQRTFEVPILPF